MAWRFLFSRGTVSNKFPIKKVTDSTLKPLEWWIEGLVPKESFCLLAGEGGAGKSSYIVYLAEKLAREQGLNVLFITSEGNGGSGYRKRMKDPNSELNNLFWMDLNSDNNPDFEYPSMKDIKDAIDKNHIDVLFIDPITMFANGDTNKGPQVRKLLSPFDRLATKHKITIFGLAHFNKPEKTAKQVKYCITGSVEWLNCSRLVYCLGKKDSETGYIVLSKANETKSDRGWVIKYEPNELSRKAVKTIECDFSEANKALSSKTSNYEDNNEPPKIISKLFDIFSYGEFTIDDVKNAGLSPDTFNCYTKSDWLLVEKRKNVNGKGAPKNIYRISGKMFKESQEELKEEDV